MRRSAEEVVGELERKARRLGERKCFYLAAVLLRYYDGERAEETIEVRRRAAQTYVGLADAQVAAARSTLQKAA